MTATKRLPEKFSTALIVSIALSYVTALGPLKIFLQNREYFSITLGTVALGSFTIFFIILAFCFALILALRTKYAVGLSYSLLAILAIVFIYENILYVFVPPLDGKASAVQSPLFYLIDVLVFGMIAGAIWLLKLPSQLVISRTCIFVLLFATFQAVVYAVLPRTNSEFLATRTAKDYDLSSELNVIQVLFDTLQSTEFDEAISNLAMANELDGFTWFRNTLGIHHMTVHSIPGIFGGRIYTENELNEFYSGEDRTVLDVLAANDFDLNIYGLFSLPTPPNTKIWLTADLETDSARTSVQFLNLLDVALIRAFPFFVKDAILNDYEFTFSKLARRSRAFGNEVHRQAFLNFVDKLHTSQNVAPRYYFIHLRYPHSPYTHNKDCTFANRKFQASSKQAKIEIACSIKDFSVLINKLKKLGVYDNTLILIHADTGTMFPNPLPIDGLSGSELRILGRNIGAAFPLLLVKPLNSRGNLAISNRAASIVDIPNTTLGGLRLPLLAGGVDLFSPDEEKKRDRVYQEFVVGNDAFEPDNWLRQEPVDGNKNTPAPSLRKGDVVGFGVKGLGHQFRYEGWLATQWGGTRTHLGPASLHMQLKKNSEQKINRLIFDVEFGPADVFPVLYSINGGANESIEFHLGDKRNAEFVIPVEMVPTDAELLLTFHFTVPDELPRRSYDRYGFRLRKMAAD